MYTYEQSTGKLYTPTGTLFDTGYSGHALGLNNPVMESVIGTGPLPSGIWNMTAMVTEPKLGQFVVVLEPDTNTRAKVLKYGRSPDSFRIHGDEVEAPGAHLASDGCLIFYRTARVELWDGSDKQIQCVSGPIIPPPQTNYPRSM